MSIGHHHHHHHHHVLLSARISLAFSCHPPNRLLLPVDLQGYIQYRHRAAVCGFELVVLAFLVHVKGSTGVHHLWVCPYFSSSVLHVWMSLGNRCHFGGLQLKSISKSIDNKSIPCCVFESLKNENTFLTFSLNNCLRLISKVLVLIWPVKIWRCFSAERKACLAGYVYWWDEMDSTVDFETWTCLLALNFMLL